MSTENQLPAEVREAMELVLWGLDPTAPVAVPYLADDLCKALAPLWPKLATTDTRWGPLTVWELTHQLKVETVKLRAQLAAAQEALDGVALACERVRAGADATNALYCIETRARAAIDAAREGGAPTTQSTASKAL